MIVYMYQAALLCAECGEVKRAELDEAGQKPDDPADESSFDSDDYPKGPYSDGGGEADTPQHCDACGVHLENPLTDEGRTYVREAIDRAHRAGRTDEDNIALGVWAPFYGEG